MVEFEEPQDDTIWRGVESIVVVASDPAGIDTLEVTIDGEPAPPDEDGDPGRYEASAVDATGCAEGASVELVAHATDQYGNPTDETIHVTCNNSGSGIAQGWVVKGPVDGAPAQIFAYAGGVQGELLGSGTSAGPAGSFTVTLAEGYSGALLVEAGGDGASYLEEARPDEVGFGTSERLTTIIPDYVDGHVVDSNVVSPVTTWARAYACRRAEGRELFEQAQLDGFVASFHVRKREIIGEGELDSSTTGPAFWGFVRGASMAGGVAGRGSGLDPHASSRRRGSRTDANLAERARRQRIITPSAGTRARRRRAGARSAPGPRSGASPTARAGARAARRAPRAEATAAAEPGA